jgi:TonB family protein
MSSYRLIISLGVILMKNSIFTLIVFVLSISGSNFGQVSPVCEQPYSYKFDEFNFSNIDEIRNRIDLFALQFKNDKEIEGYIIGYDGRKPEKEIVVEKSFQVIEVLENSYNISRNRKVFYIGGGYRENQTIEFFIKPKNCSEEPKATPSLKIEDVNFKEEETFYPSDLVIKSISEIKKLVIKRVEPNFPAAAKAVGARGKVLLLIIVNEDGKVLKAKAVAGHPLLRAASETAVRFWEFTPIRNDEKPIKFGGKVVIDWDIIFNKRNSEYKISNN